MLRGILQEQRLQRRYREHFQVVHYSIQSNHLHLIVEAADPRSMRVGVSALVIAFAKRLDKGPTHVAPPRGGRRPQNRALTLTDAPVVVTAGVGSGMRVSFVPTKYQIASPPAAAVKSAGTTIDA